MNPAQTSPVRPPSREARRIRRMFSQIAPRYDLLNHLLSANTDVRWRRIVVDEAVNHSQRRILDLACGTGDLAIEMSRHAHPGCQIIGADFARPMLQRARQKDASVPWIEADGLRLPFHDAQFDLVTIAFGIRNMESLEDALAEIHRVLKPGGTAAILEFSQPENPFIRAIYYPYFLYALPWIGALLSQKSAYLYLPSSVLHFPNRRELAHLMKKNGFSRVRHCSLSMGIAAIHLGTRTPKNER